MTLAEAIAVLERAVPDPTQGLPEELFLYLTRVTPMVNVDLLVQDQRGTLLAWRDDPYAGAGWHVPGGVVRFRERFEDRIRQVALNEIGCEVTFDPEPAALHQLVFPWLKNRSHFISVLYRCQVPAGWTGGSGAGAATAPGELRWFERCPVDLLACQQIYRRFVG